MKSIKPNNMALAFKIHVLDNKELLSISAFATFSFNLNEPRLFDEQELWSLAKLNLGKDEILDFGAPKHRSEFLVYGSCYSQQPTRGIGVYVQVANISKTLVIMGQHSWSTFGITEVSYFSCMPINYSNAYGGEEYALNPLGKGYSSKTSEQIELPNIIDPNYPITSKADRPQPAGFTAYPIMWPQRMNYMGKIDNKYFTESWPHLPKGTNPEFFNAAPQDQRLTGFFKGNETFTIKNMHPQNNVQNSKLPELRARMFIVQKTENGDEVFKELTTQAETLWLFPNQEAGTLLYRGSTEVIDEEYSDVNYLYAVWEHLSEAPKTIDFYYQQFNHEINPPQEIAAPPEPSLVAEEIPEITPEVATMAAPEEAPTVNPALEKAMDELKEMEATLSAQLKATNINLDAAKADLLKKATPAANTAPADLNTIIKQLETQNADLAKKFNLTANDTAKLLAKSNPTTTPPVAQDVITKLNASGIKNPEFESSLIKLEQLNQSLPKVEESEQKIEDPVIPEASSTPPITEESILLAAPMTTEEVVKKYNFNKNLSNLDLSNLDLGQLNFSEADFSNTILENTNFKESTLNNTKFINSRLNNANFFKSSLSNATFVGSYAATANFEEANLTSTKIDGSDFNSCNFNNSTISNATFNQSNFESSNFSNAKAIQLTTINCIFAACNFSKADFSKALLQQSDLSNALIDQTNFTSIEAPELKLFGTTGLKPCFKYANLDNSRADENTHLNKANFSHATIATSTWEGMQMSDSDLTGVTLNNSNFSGCKFQNVRLELALAKNTNFSKTQFNNCDLNRINLFKGSLRRSLMNDVDLRYSNLFGVDLYKAKLVNTNLKGTNINRTLLSTELYKN